VTGNEQAREEEGAVENAGSAPDSAIGGTPTSGTDVPGSGTNGSATAGAGVVPEDLLASGQVPDDPPPEAEPVEHDDGGDPAGALAGGDPAELERVRTELEERTSDLQRVSAEYANYRRRVDRDREGTVAGAKAQVAGELMLVLDDVDRAAAHGDLTGPIKGIADRLAETLTRIGLSPFGNEGDPFDPSVHEAVAHETSAEVTAPTVSTVMRRGYRFGERVLRPAMVAVTDADPDAASAPPAAAAASPSATNADAV